MLFIITQAEQPAFIIEAMQSQQPWIMSAQALSPLVQVMQQPSSIISTLHIPIMRLQQQVIMAQHEHMPPAIIEQRFWNMAADILSSHLQVIFIPPAQFSNIMVQHGTIIIPGAAAEALSDLLERAGDAERSVLAEITIGQIADQIAPHDWVL